MTNATLKNKAKKLSPAFAVAMELTKKPDKYYDNEELIKELIEDKMPGVVFYDFDFDCVLDDLSQMIEKQLEDTELEEYIDDVFDLIS